MAQNYSHFTGLEAHLIVVPEVADPYVLIHVGVVKVLTQPADVTPIEIPFTFTAVRETGSDLRTEALLGSHSTQASEHK